MTFNTGTTEGIVAGVEASQNHGYGDQQAKFSDQHYGDGLAWNAAVQATRKWFDAMKPHVVGLQEVFWAGECANVPAEARAGFYCEGHKAGGPTVASYVLGPNYQVACHEGKPDKCIAVHESVGRIRGCDEAFCLSVPGHGEIDGCGKGARVALFEIECDDLAPVRVVHVHGSSGLAKKDQGCRLKQFQRAFELYGTTGARLMLGDFNTDPTRFSAADTSAAWLRDTVAARDDAHWVTDIADSATPTYAGLASIDHIITSSPGASFNGTCKHAGLDGDDPVWNGVYFDHRPSYCDLTSAL